MIYSYPSVPIPFTSHLSQWPHKKNTKIGFLDQLSLNAGQKHCRMLQGEHSAILSTFIKLPFVIKISVWSIFEWPIKTGFTVIFLIFQKNIYGWAFYVNLELT